MNRGDIKEFEKFVQIILMGWIGYKDKIVFKEGTKGEQDE